MVPFLSTSDRIGYADKNMSCERLSSRVAARRTVHRAVRSESSADLVPGEFAVAENLREETSPNGFPGR